MSNPIKKWTDRLVEVIEYEDRYNDLCDKMECVLTKEECEIVYDNVYAIKGGHHAK